MILVKEIKPELFPTEFISYLPLTCESCGSDTEVIESLTYLQCSNLRCISKVGYRLWLLLQDLGVTYLEVKECIKFLQCFETTNPYSILLYNPINDGELYEGYGIEKSEELYKNLNQRRGMLLWEFIKIGNFDGLNDSVEKILKEYTDLYLFYENIAEGGIGFIQKLLLTDVNIEDVDSICVEAVLIYDVFISNKEDILEGLAGIVVIKPEFSLGVLFANNVSSYSSNKSFLSEVNKTLKNKIYLYPLNLLSDNVSLVYWDDLGLNISNSVVEEVKEKHPKVLLVDETNIYDSILQVVTDEGE